MAAPACHPCYPGSPSIGYSSCGQDRCSGLPHCRKGSTTPSCVSRLHPGSLTLRPAGLLDSLTEPLSGNLMFQVTLYTSLKLRERTTELPRSDFNRLVIRFTRHTLRVHTCYLNNKLKITIRIVISDIAHEPSKDLTPSLTHVMPSCILESSFDTYLWINLTSLTLSSLS